MGFFRDRFSAIIGNFLEHYDSALFAFLAPFIAPLFFDTTDPITALILTYAILPLGLITRPIGSLFFGWIGDNLGRRVALFYSLLGMAVITIAIGLIPIYRDIGIWAPISLAIARSLQSFFAAGGSSGGAIFILERTESSKRGLMSSCYDASSIGGILLASALVTLISSQGWVLDYWRILFWGGGGTAIFGVFLRALPGERVDVVKSQKSHGDSLFSVLKLNRGALFSLILASGFSHIIYSVVFTLMNGYIPLVTDLSKDAVMKVNTILLIGDMLLLPFFGYLANRFGKERVMFAGALFSAIGAIPLFALLNQATLCTVIIVRSTLMLFGIAFAAPYHAWAMDRAPPEHRYLILSFGAALGSQFMGAPTSAVCLWLFKVTGWSFAPGIYLALGSLVACRIIYLFMSSHRRLRIKP